MQSRGCEELRAAFEPGGALARAIPGYQFREAQVEMACAVWRAFATSRPALIESGTGTGKSLAYLVPAVLWAVSNDAKVVVSTNTINLQEQLIRKDLPSLAEALGPRFSYTLVKGRGNYVCRRKLASAQREVDESGDPTTRQAFAALLAELATSQSGSRSDFAREVAPDIWDMVASDSLSCLRARCPFAGHCYFARARSEMEASHILVTNHHLLFSDLALRRAAPGAANAGVLPEYEHLVLDEAHNVPAVAAEHLGCSASLARFHAIAQHLARSDPRRRAERGLLLRLRRTLARGAGSSAVPAFPSSVARRIDAAIEGARRLDETSGAFFDAVRRAVAGAASGGRDGVAVRLRDELTQGEAWQEEVIPSAERLRLRASELEAEIARILEFADAAQADQDEERASDCADLHGLAGRLSAEGAALDFVVARPDDSFVYWCRTDAQDVELIATPLDVAPILRASLFEAVSSVVLTSATLTVQGEFEFLKREVGLDGLKERPLERVFDSPFDFRRQALLAVTTDLPEPQEPGFVARASRAVLDLVTASRGRAFVLFTSTAMMAQVEQAIRPGLEAAGIPVFRQGEIPRHRMLTLFREQPGALLGADSFWQGVDVPGEALSCVIMVRLPFQVPTDPVVEAKMEMSAARGANGFYSYALPSAVVRFRQGFGRLIRTREDTGVVVVLDRRLVAKGYGRAFLSSIPAPTFISGPTAEVVEAVRDWLR